ncbi:activin receptor type-2A-like [Aricia agestis]|uniref:activin receptor type-2A-like n=1 Tax=Aricia agestis TaxID=91739 RepID=UPI001C20BD4A|nr:activin receptor type-2A-like [Aricia agestis]
MTSKMHILGTLLLALGATATTFQGGIQTDQNLPPRPKEGGIDTRYCEFYNGTSPDTCDSTENSTCPPQPIIKDACQPIEAYKSNHCFVIWYYDNTTNKATVQVKGCFIDTVACNQRASRCRIHNNKRPLLHCCCEGDMCNANMTFPGYEAGMSTSTEPPPERIPTSPLPTPDSDTNAVIAYILTPLFLLFALLVGCYFLYRKRKSSSFAELASGEVSLSRPPSAGGGMEEAGGLLGQVTLCEVRARGRFGAVWRAKLGPRDVAVKVFPLQDKQSWLAEQKIYRLPRMDHPDILHFIGVDKKGDNLQAEYWLITAYHEKGSLCDYLKAHTLTWAEAWRVAAGVARGLAHLHEEDGGKPAIAHRDFKSKNVLLKADLSACIADFGLALVFVAGHGCGDAHGQVGTRRYMAPEVLDGAINFTKDAFLRIDMYACALVLWEIVSRCIEGGIDPAAQYRLPLEEEVGSHPGLEEMQETVVQRKMRPQIQPQWRNHPGLAVLCDTMEECWDHDAEARLSASCVLERVATQRPAPPAPPPAATPDTTPLLIHELA